MKRLIKAYFYLLFICLLPFIGVAQTTSTPSPKWKEIERLISIRNYEQMLPVLADIKAEARRKDNSAEWIRAIVAEGQTKKVNRTNDSSFVEIEKYFQQQIKQASAVEKAILNNFYALFLASNINRYLSDTDNDFIASDSKQKIKHIDSLFNLSLEPKESLLQAPLEKWGDLFVSIQNVSLSPTLYHFLAYQYIDFLATYQRDNEDKVNKLKQNIIAINQSKGYANATSYVHSLKQGNSYAYGTALETTTNYLDIIAKNKSDYNAYLLAQVAGIYNSRNNKKEALKYVNQALTEYPESPWIDEAKNLLKVIKQVNIQLTAKSFAPANQYTPIRISTSNADSLYIRVYNTSNTLKSYRTFDVKYDSLTHQTSLDAKLVYEESLSLKSFTDYQSHSTLYKLNPLPFGNYTVLVSNNKDFKDDGLYLEVVNQQIIISDLFISASQDKADDNSTLFKGLLLDRMSGKPYTDQKIQLYELNRYNTLDLVQGLRTDTKGEFSYASKQQREFGDYLLYLPQENQLIDLSRLKTIGRHVYNRPQPDESNQISIQTLTDRAIYRPGQRVYFKSILYNSHALLGKVMEKEELKIYLHDANYQKIDSLTLSSNAYGSINGSFILPNKTLTGSFRIVALHKGKEQGSHYFQVEEYKRPTFKVTFDTNKETYTLRDTAVFTGSVEMLSGAALPDATVKYNITFYSNKHRQYVTYIDTTMTTDAEGKFAFKVALMDSTFKGLDNFYLQYNAEVTSQSGEMQAAGGQYSFSTRPWQIQIQTSSRMEEKKWKNLTIKTTNQNHQPLLFSGKVNIYRLSQPTTVMTRESSQIFGNLECHLLSIEEYERYFPTTFDRSLLQKEPQKELLASYDFDTRDTGLVQIDSNLFAKGRYMIEAISIQDGDTIRATNYVQLYDAVTKKVSNNEFLIANTDKTNYSIGDKVTITYQTDEKNAKYLYLFSSLGASKKPTQLLAIKNGQATYTFTLEKEQVSPNISFTALLVVNNKLAITSTAIPVLRQDKLLRITAKTFRDKITPGQKEKWSFSIAQKDLPVSEAEVLATMYDSALDVFANNTFPSSLPLNTPYFDNIQYYYLINGFYKDDYSNSTFYKDNRLPTLGNGLSPIYTYGLFTGGLLNNQQFFNDFNSLDEVIVTVGGRQKKMVSGVATGSTKGVEGVFESVAMYDELRDPKLRAEVENLRIRGAASPGQSTPLYVVDGEIIDGFVLENFSADQIEKLEVLKDAAAVALYGSKAANGVILVTTKEGKKKQDLLDQAQTRTNLQETAFFFPTLYTDAEGNINFEFDSPEALTKWKLLLFAHRKDLTSGDATFISQTQKQLMVRPNLPRYFREGDEITLKAQVQNISKQALKGNARIEILNPENDTNITNLFLAGNSMTAFEVPATSNSIVEWKLKVPAHIPTVQIKIVAATDSFSDGEIAELPILSNKVLISDTEKIILKPRESKDYDLNSARKDNLHAKVQIQRNPILEIIATLDYLKNYPYESTEQSGSKWFGLKMVQYMEKNYPEIATYFKTLDKDQSKSKLEENSSLSELKQEEMPWLRAIKSEKEKLAAIASLFNSDIQGEINSVEKKILQNQIDEGGFSWLQGGKVDSRISIRMLEIVGKVLHLDHSLVDSDMLDAMENLTQYLDQDSSIFNPKASIELALSYLYARHYWTSYFKPQGNSIQQLTNKLVKAPEVTAKGSAGLAAKAWVVNQLYGNAKQSNELKNRISQEVVHDKDRGMYWPSNDRAYDAVSMQSYLVEAYKLNDPSQLQAITQWLYYKKQVNHWSSTWMTVDAIYALLIANNPDDFSLDNKVNVLVDRQQTDTKDIVLGQVSLDFDRSALEKDKQLAIQNNNNRTIYGGIYHQYFVPLSEVKRNTNALSVQKQYLVERNGTWVETKEARLGERIKVKIIVINDAPLQYVHLKDSRPSGVEPIYQPSGYRWWQGYYFSMKDASTNYFFDHLGKGKREFEYEIKTNNIGIFNSGISSIECMYDPTVNARSANIQLVIVP
ncbi:alpha-2-macroglobulin family protein [Sphingobacterium yanglingense]|uniref:TonB-dependent SusC/RagA subfamily outer membrane receptor n=1 Tax=Sphingobacterium yanglingense TaxID=1437280 RepID=A0A4R6WYM1_9SPHI|nr:MG2 domain-containing protein [Sphingobacterium yanglingense]TDQ82887.1 TonB-dependent SusC/RagA subfamily outer membrane receptor [Sphingobacterium yanglingense]